jgi:hypothetical protein
MYNAFGEALRAGLPLDQGLPAGHERSEPTAGLSFSELRQLALSFWGR